jgi:hypothetical protein
MNEPSPIYAALGEQLDPATIKILVRQLEAMRGDGISIVRTAEQGLRDLGVEIDTSIVVKSREERRRERKSGGL